MGRAALSSVQLHALLQSTRTAGRSRLRSREHCQTLKLTPAQNGLVNRTLRTDEFCQY